MSTVGPSGLSGKDRDPCQSKSRLLATSALLSKSEKLDDLAEPDGILGGKKAEPGVS